MQDCAWSSLEIAKLTVGVLTPVAMASIGWFISRRLKKLEHAQWANQKLTEKRLRLYDDVAPLLNKLFCFYLWIGYWKDVSPKDVIEAKRSLDKTVNIYRFLLGEEFYKEYQAFIHLLFVPYSGAGHDALIRSLVRSEHGDRTRDGAYQWSETWVGSFTDSSKVAPAEAVERQYQALMNAFKDSLGIQR